MTRSRMLVAVVLIGTVAGTACTSASSDTVEGAAGTAPASATGSGESTLPSAGADGGTAADSATTTTKPGARQSTATTSPKKKSGGDTSTTTVSTLPPGGEHINGTEGFPFEVSITPPCVQHGGLLTIRITTRPLSSIAGVLMYADGGGDAYTVGDADGRGEWEWRVVIPPNAAEGQGQALLSAQDRTPHPSGGASTTGEGASGRYPFEVRKRCP